MNMPVQTILIIDDDLLIKMALEKILQKKGYRVLYVSNSENLFSTIRENNVDLIVLDLYLSEIDGIEILKFIRTCDEFSNIPIIMLTSEESPDVIEKCLDSGATDFIIKPIVPKVLLARIRSALTNRENILQIETQKTEISLSKQRLADVLYHLEKDIEKARTTQTTLIPSRLIQSSYYSMHSYYKPMNQVGGDFFSHYLENGQTDILFGDVSGHGISSAMVSCMAVLCFQTTTHKRKDVSSELLFLHKTLRDYVKGHYITGVYLRFDASSNILSYAYAGHHSILLIRGNELIELAGKGTPLILMNDFISTSHEIKIQSGDRVFLFSDGLFEIFNPQNEFYGGDNFVLDIKNKTHLKGEEFLKAVFESSMSFSANVVKDDMTMLLIEFSF
jgi:phosphoserine phosphatase RsbU/P